MNPYDYVNAINFNKKNLMRGSENDELAEKDYSPFLTNRTLSYHSDTVALANEMNRRHQLPKKMQFEFLLNTVRMRKRFAKWEKKENHSDLELVKEYFGYSDTKALQALTILTTTDLTTIRKKLEKGGKDA